MRFDGEFDPQSFVHVCEECSRWTRARNVRSRKITEFGEVAIRHSGDVRLLAQCTACGKAAVMSEKDFVAFEQKVTEDVRNSPNVDAVPEAEEALWRAITAHKHDAFDKQARVYSARFTEHGDLLRAVIYGYNRFEDASESEKHAKALLALEPGDESTLTLARVYIRAAAPQKAEALLSGMKTPAAFGHLSYVAELYAEAGDHESAQRIFDAVSAHDENAMTPDFLEMLKRGGPFQHLARLRYLPEAKDRALYERELPARAKPQRNVALMAGALALFLVVVAGAILLDKEKVWFVNGTAAPYSVTLDGERFELAPGHTLKKLKKGPHTLAAFQEGQDERAFSTEFDVASDSKGHTQWINPDRGAIFLYEESEFAVNPRPNAFYLAEFKGASMQGSTYVDYAFKPFPAEVTIEDDVERRSRVQLYTDSIYGVVNTMTQQKKVPALAEILMAHLYANPQDSIALEELIVAMPPERDAELQAFLLSGLEAKPARIPWYRAVQGMLLRMDPGVQDDFYKRIDATEDPCLVSMQSWKKVSDRDAQLTTYTNKPDACNDTLATHALVKSYRGQSEAALALVKKMKRDEFTRQDRISVRSMNGAALENVKEFERYGNEAKEAMTIQYQFLNGQRADAQRGIQAYRSTLQALEKNPNKDPQALANRLRWAVVADEVEQHMNATPTNILASENEKAKSIARWVTQKGKPLPVFETAPDELFFRAARAYVRGQKKEAQGVTNSILKFFKDTPIQILLESQSKPSMSEARDAAAFVQLPAMVHLYLGAKYKDDAFYAEADRLNVGLDWFSLLMRTLPYDWRQGRIRN